MPTSLNFLKILEHPACWPWREFDISGLLPWVLLPWVPASAATVMAVVVGSGKNGVLKYEFSIFSPVVGQAGNLHWCLRALDPGPWTRQQPWTLDPGPWSSTFAPAGAA